MILEKTPRFDELFEHYQEEYDYLESVQAEGIWNEELLSSKSYCRQRATVVKELLSSKSYYELTDWHIRELTRLRFLPNDWPQEVQNMIFKMDGAQMLTLSQIETNVTLCELKSILGIKDDQCLMSADKNSEFRQDWADAQQKAEDLALDADLSLADFSEWEGMELAVDFYRLRNADELAFRDIDPDRLPEYRLLSEVLSEFDQTVADELPGEHSVGDVFKERFGSLFTILNRFATGEASDHFLIDTENDTLTDLKNAVERNEMM